MKYKCRDCGGEIRSGHYMYAGVRQRLCNSCIDGVKGKIEEALGIHITGNDSHYFFVPVKDLEELSVRMR